MSGIDRESVEALAEKLGKDVFYGEERLHKMRKHNPMHLDAIMTIRALLSDLDDARTALAAAEAREAKLRAALQGQQKLHRRLQLLEGFWQRKLAREKTWSAHVWSIFARENPGTAAIVEKAVEKAVDDIEMACDLDGKLMKKVRVELSRAALTDKGDTDNDG